MAAESALVRDLAIVLIAAAVTSVVFQRFRQPAVLGYLVAGVVVGPHVLPLQLIRDPASIATLAELGTLFLLFSLGLHFHIGKLKRLGAHMALAGVLALAVMMGAATLAVRLLGWSALDSVFLGAILALSGATVVIKVLEDLGRAEHPATQLAFGLLVVEKVAAIVILALLSSLAVTGTFRVADLAELVGRIALFAFVTLVLGFLLVPRFVDMVARLRSQDTLVIAVVGLAFGMALLGGLMGLGLGLGAFIAGAVVAAANSRALVEDRVAPLRDAFVAVFFVSMGLLVNPSDVLRLAVPVVALSLVVVAGKTLTVAATVFVAGAPPRDAFHAGLSMAMLGGFGLVIANVGQDLGVLDPSLFALVAAVTAVTAFVTPVLVRQGDALASALSRVVPPVVRAHARAYSARVARARAHHGGGLPRALAGRLARVGAYATLLAVLVLAFGVAQERVGSVRLARPLVESALALGAWGVFALLVVPVAWALVHAVRSLADALVGALSHGHEAHGRGVAAVELVVRHTVYAFSAALTGAVVFAAGGLFLPPLPVLLAVSVALLGGASLFRRSLRALNRELEDTVDAILAGAPSDERAEVLALLRERYGGTVDFALMSVPGASPVAGRTIREAAIPQRTGATIVTLEREGVRRVNPPPDAVIEAGDLVCVIGSREEVAATRSLLVATDAAEGADIAGVVVDEVPVGRASTVAGVPLAESRLREATGVTVMALVREGRPLASPAPATILRPGDVLVLLGTADQTARARALLEGRAWDR